MLRRADFPLWKRELEIADIPAEPEIARPNPITPDISHPTS